MKKILSRFHLCFQLGMIQMCVFLLSVLIVVNLRIFLHCVLVYMFTFYCHAMFASFFYCVLRVRYL